MGSLEVDEYKYILRLANLNRVLCFRLATFSCTVEKAQNKLKAGFNQGLFFISTWSQQKQSSKGI